MFDVQFTSLRFGVKFKFDVKVTQRTAHAPSFLIKKELHINDIFWKQFLKLFRIFHTVENNLMHARCIAAVT